MWFSDEVHTRCSEQGSTIDGQKDRDPVLDCEVLGLALSVGTPVLKGEVYRLLLRRQRGCSMRMEGRAQSRIFFRTETPPASRSEFILRYIKIYPSIKSSTSEFKSKGN